VSGEFELIAALRERLARAGASGPSGALVLGSGDDAAVTVRDGATVTSVDALVEGVHFRVPPFTHRQVGHKALATALSDLAAMGAAPGEAYVQLGVPDDRSDTELLELADGLAELAASCGVAVAGGDVTRAPGLFVAITAVGFARSEDDLVRRSGAAPGDAIAATGELGGAAAGLLLLERPELADAVGADVADALRGRQLEPQPRLGAGRALAGAGAKAMIDLSDGLGADAGHLAEAGGVGIEIELTSLPLQRGVEEVAAAAGVDALDLAANGGEDYELLVVLDAADIERPLAAFEPADAGVGLTVIGRVVSAEGVVLSGPEGVRPAGGFDQLRHRRAPADPA
jgi:thiamine-monophosphate kinase